MMQKKKLKLLLANLAASVILFATPLSVAATGTSSDNTEKAPDTAVVTDLSKLDSALTIPDSSNPCPSGCIHVFEATDGDAAHTVQIISGVHTVYLRGNLKITSDKNDPTKDAPPIRIAGTANVTLALESDCVANLDGGNTSYAGIQVEDKAQLTIRGNGKLNATGGTEGGAGIGGSSQSANVGGITILDGIITAEGNCGGAGIGSGVGGAAASNITIKGGNVTATGSDGVSRGGAGSTPVPPGPGIGSHMVGGNIDQNILGKASGNITISGGTVNAFGGKYVEQNRYAGGIQAQNLTSDKGSTVIYTNDAELLGVGNASTLNAIIWEKANAAAGKPTEGTVWGNATLNEPLTDQTLNLMTSSTLTIGSQVGFNLGSAIIGDNSNRIIDVDNLQGPGDVQVPNKIVTLNETDFLEYDPFNENKEQTFSGTDKDFTDTILRHRQTRPNSTYGPLPVDSSKWNAPVIQNGKATVSKICNAGYYTVTYQHTENADRKFTLSGIHVAQRDLNDCTIVIPDQIYNGKAQEPEVSILLGNAPLALDENDYTLSGWENNIDVGEVSVGITANSQGNLVYSDDRGNLLTKTYNIIGVPLDNAVVTVDPSSGTYNGSEHMRGKDFKITVSLDGVNLKEDTDYEITSAEDADLTNAGEVIYTVAGIKNYSGSKDVAYTINKKEITIKPNSITVEPKDYDGNGEVTIKDAKFDGLVSSDEGKVKIKSNGIVDEDNEGHAGEYPNIHFEGEIELEYEDADGNRTPCTNYTVKYDGEEIPLKEKAVIDKVEPESRKPKHIDPYTVNENGTTFDCTIQIDRQPGIRYQFKMDGDPAEEEGWISEIDPTDKETASAVFRGIAPAENDDDKHIFYVRSEGTDDVIEKMMDIDEVVFVKLPNPKTAPKPTISYNEEGNPDKKTYTITIDKIEDNDIEYRIVIPGSEEGVEFSDTNVEPAGAPGTRFIGQVRYRETVVYEASEPASSDEIKTPASPLSNSGPKYKFTWKRIIPNQSDNIELPAGLQEANYEKMEEVTADLTRYLSQLGAYQDKEHTAFYDVKVQVITVDETGTTVTRDALPGDFENGGIPVVLPAKQLPDGVNATENQFSAVHMFETYDYAEYSPGDIEICTDSEGSEVFLGSGKGVTFIVNGASPVGIAWSEAPEEPTTPPEDPGTDPGTTPGTDPGTDSGTGTDPSTMSATDPTSDNNQNNNSNDGSQNDGSGNKDEDTESIAEALKSAIASLSPKTGDKNNIILWVVIAAAACIAAIVAIRKKAKSGKKAKAGGQKSADAAGKKTTTAASKKTSAPTAKKSTASTSKTTKKSAAGKKTTTKK